MSSIDDLFKRPNLPGKRKLEPTQDPTTIYKSAKLTANGTAKANGAPPAATVEEDVEAEEEIEAGPARPTEDEDQGPDDDEEGRFFGGGISGNTKEIFDFIDSRDGAGEGAEEVAEVIDALWMRKMAIGFERKINKNAEMRSRWENDPAKFMASEADLDVDIKSLSILAEHPELYDEFAQLGCVGSLVSLLSHENTDIAIAAIEVIGELTDEDIEAEEEQWTVLVDAMLDADLVDLLTQNLSRLDERHEADRSGVYHVLNVIENLSSQSSIAERIGQNSSILNWLLMRIQQSETIVGQNKQYAAEILAILLQSSPKNRSKFSGSDGLDALLQLLAAYRKRDPVKESDEEEYVENLFDALTCLVDESTGKGKFITAEGIELCLIMLREGKMSKNRALRVLDHAMGGSAGASVCEHFVEVFGLKTIFGMFMKKQENKEMVEHMLGIFSSLLRSLPGGSAGRIRTLAKFVEKDYEKIVKLVNLRRTVAERVEAVEETMQAERPLLSEEDRGDVEGEWLSRRFDAGLFSVQTIDVILAWLIAEDAGASARIRDTLKGKDQGFEIIKATLQEQLNGLSAEDGEGEKDTRDMLNALLQFV